MMGTNALKQDHADRQHTLCFSNGTASGRVCLPQLQTEASLAAKVLAHFEYEL